MSSIGNSIVICGDTHGLFEEFQELLDKGPSEVIVCGDFGVWNKRKIRDGNGIATGKYGWFHTELVVPEETSVYFCDGNHEDHDYLCSLVSEHGYEYPIEISKNIFYCPRGCVHELKDGTRVLFMGGAESGDKEWRTEGDTWFPQEVISESDMEILPDTKIDIVVSHTCPLEAGKNMPIDVDDTLSEVKLLSMAYKIQDSSCVLLDKVYEKYKPKEWYFGHFHYFSEFSLTDSEGKETRFTALNAMNKRLSTHGASYIIKSA